MWFCFCLRLCHGKGTGLGGNSWLLSVNKWNPQLSVERTTKGWGLGSEKLAPIRHRDPP